MAGDGFAQKGVVMMMVLLYFRRLRYHHWLIALAMCVCVYFGYIYNVLAYARTTPFTAFSYPLEVDMETLVERVENGEKPAVQPINRIDYPYVLNCDNRCRSDEESGMFDSIFTLIVIKSAIGNQDRRDAIRQTWGDENAASPVVLRRVFIIGVTPGDRDLQARVGAESQKHGDIVQRFFVDDYYNNTLKLMTGFEWATVYCEGAQFIAFLDDDYYLSPANMVDWLRQQPRDDAASAVLGYVWRYAMPIRQYDSKWYISLEEYPYRYWPPYAAAGSMFVSMAAARRIAAAMPYVKYLRFDDAFIGIIGWKLHIEFRGSRRIIFDKHAKYSAERFHNVIAAHGYGDPQRLKQVWTEQEAYWKSRG